MSFTAAAGDLRGWLVVVGEVAAPAKLEPGRDACCIDAAPTDQRVLVGEGGGLANVVVRLMPQRGAALANVPPPPSEPVEVTNSRCAFTPHVVVARVGQPLVLANDDPTAHNVSGTTRSSGSWNLVLPPGDRRTLKLEGPERSPVALRCNVHPFMCGYVVVADHPWVAVTDAQGRFEILDLPEGEARFQFWHETGELAAMTLPQGATDRRGRVNLKIPAAGELDLGELRIDAEELR